MPCEHLCLLKGLQYKGLQRTFVLGPTVLFISQSQKQHNTKKNNTKRAVLWQWCVANSIHSLMYESITTRQEMNYLKYSSGIPSLVLQSHGSSSRNGSKSHRASSMQKNSGMMAGLLMMPNTDMDNILDSALA